jgi:hypothetical protein
MNHPQKQKNSAIHCSKRRLCKLKNILKVQGMEYDKKLH